MEEAEPDFSGVATRSRSCDTPRTIRSTPSWRTSTRDWLKDTIIGRSRRRSGSRPPTSARAAARQAQMYLQVARVLLTLRLLRAAGDAGRAVRRERCRTRRKSPARRCATYIDWMRTCWYVTFMAHAGDLRAGRLHARRTAGGAPDRRAASRRLERAAARARVRAGDRSRKATAARYCVSSVCTCRQVTRVTLLSFSAFLNAGS